MRAPLPPRDPFSAHQRLHLLRQTERSSSLGFGSYAATASAAVPIAAESTPAAAAAAPTPAAVAAASAAAAAAVAIFAATVAISAATPAVAILAATSALTMPATHRSAIYEAIEATVSASCMEVVAAASAQIARCCPTASTATALTLPAAHFVAAAAVARRVQLGGVADQPAGAEPANVVRRAQRRA